MAHGSQLALQTYLSITAAIIHACAGILAPVTAIAATNTLEPTTNISAFTRWSTWICERKMMHICNYSVRY